MANLKIEVQSGNSISVGVADANNLNVDVQGGNNINVEVTPTPNQTIVLDRGVAGVGIESVAIVYNAPTYYLEFTYTNGTTELVALPAIVAGVTSFNTRIGVVTLTSSDVTTALGYTPPTPTGTGASGTWAISVSGNAATATNVPYTGLTGAVPTWNQNTTGNAATVTNGVYTTDTGTVTNTMLAGSIANNKLTNSAITINGVSTSLGGSASVGTVTSVGGTGSVNGITLTGAVTSSGNLTLGGSLSGVSLTTQVTGTLPIANGGTNATTAPDARTSLGLGSAAVLNAGTALGVATLDAGGTVPLSQIPASIQGGLNYQGVWNASTNTPTLTSSVGTKGYYYAVSVAGSTNLNGITDWNIGDLAVYDGTAWQQIDNTDAVTSVNGFTGTVVLGAADVGAVGTITSSDGSIDVVTTGATVDLVVSAASPASTLLASVRNQTGATLTKGTVVYISGATSNKALVSKAIATSDATSAQTLGLITTNLANNANGYVTIIGALTNLNTSAFTEGVQLYLSSTTAGEYTATKQYAPNHLVYVGIVTRSHPTQGTIEVKVQNGYEMDELHDVSAQTPSNGNVLIWNATTQLWEAAGITAGTGVSVTNGAGSITVANTGVTSFNGGTTGLTPSTATTGAVTLAGTLGVANGGTGLTSVTANRIPYGNGTSALQTSANLTFDGTTLTNTGNAVISDNSANAALRITQVGAGNALLVEDSANPDATPTVIDNSGRVLVGVDASRTLFTAYTPSLQVEGTTSSTFSQSITANINTSASPVMFFAKSRGTTNGSNTIVSVNDTLGVISFNGADGTDIQTAAAQILSAVDGTPGANDMPGRLVFSTTADGASSPTERMRIDSAGRLGIGASAVASIFVNIGHTLTGATSVVSVRAINTIASDVTSSVAIFRTQPFTQAAAFTLGSLTHFEATQGTIGATSAIANQYGFSVNSTLNGATNNFGFYSNIASGTGRFNFYANGTAANVFSGTTSIGGLVGAESLRVTPVASAVNYFNAQGSTTGNTPQLAVQGSDANIQFSTSSKGSSEVNFFTNSYSQQQFAITHTASAVNYLQVTGGAAGVTPQLRSSGTNIPVAITGSNTWAGFANASAALGVATDITSALGAHVVIGSVNGNAPYIGASNYSTSSNNGLRFMTAGTTQFYVTNTASAVNYFQVTGSATGGGPGLTAAGSDTNISTNFVTKGTGNHVFYTNGSAPQLVIAHTASTANYLQVTGAATGTAVNISAQGSDANIDLALTPKGTGVLKFGTYTAGILAQAGYITIKDAAGNTRNILVG